MEEKWTKGPWAAGKRTEHGTFHPGTIFTSDFEASVGMVYGLPINCRRERIDGDVRYEEALANARLIAAAPDLYEALKTAVGELCMVRMQDAAKVGQSYSSENDALLKPMIAALRKARGDA